MSTFSRTATLFSAVALGSMLTTTTVSSINTVVDAAETTQTASQRQDYKLQILQGDKDATSTASQFYLNTISLEKLANGDYYAYLTSHTPVNLGDEPISSNDSQHHVTKMGKTEKNGYNETVYRMTLKADELASGQPIKTQIHVNIPMMSYVHDYTIRLAVQGFKPAPAESSSAASSSVAPSSSSAASTTSQAPSSSVAQSSASSSTSSVASSKESQPTSVAPSTSKSSSVSSSQKATSDTTVSTVDKSKTGDSKVADDSNKKAVAGKEVKLTADQGMDKFLKPTARINVKGDKTDVTLSLSSDQMAGMIPYIILDGQKKSVTGQDTTFTIPTKDLQANKDGQVTLKSTTHVDALGHVADYPSNLTFNVGNLTAKQDIFKTGNYQINVSPDNHMDKFFAPKFNVKIGDQTSVVTVTYGVPSLMSMIPSVTFDGQTKDTNGKTSVDFTIPTKDLTPNKDGKVTIASNTSVPMSPHKSYDSNITFDMNQALKQPASSSSDTSTKPDKDILQDGTYSINYNVYKTGTTDDSTMANYMTESAKVSVKDGQATIDFPTKNDAMSMMKKFSVNGVKAQAKGDSWVVTLPAKDLAKTMKSEITIFVEAINFTETPSADISFDMKSAKKIGDGSSESSSSSQASSSSATKPSQSSSSAASESKPTPAKPDIQKDGKYAINYKVYKSGTTEDSVMANYMTDSAKVTVKDGKATIDFATKSNAMSMMKQFSVNGTDAKAKGDSWVVTLPAKDLAKTLKANMTIFVEAINFTETPSADISFDMKSIKDISNDGAGSSSSSEASSSSAASESKPSQSSSSAASESKPNQSSSSASSESKPNQSSSSAASESKPSQSSSSAASESKPSQSSSSAASESKPSQSSSSASSESKPSQTSSSSVTTPSNPTPAKPDIQKDGKYAINYKVYKSGTTEDSVMANYMTDSAKVTVKDGKATIDFATKNKAMSMMKQFSVNGVDAKVKGDSWVVTLPAKDLMKTLKADMTIYVAQMGFTEKPSADISFDMKSIKDISNDGAGSSSSSEASSSSAASESKPSQSSSSAASESKPSQSSSNAASESKPSQSSSSASSESKPSQTSSSSVTTPSNPTPAKPDIQKDGKYSINYKVYQTGTTEESVMANYMTDSAKVTVKDGKATIDFATKNKAMSMMQKFSVNGVDAKVKGDSWVVTLPAKDLMKTLKADMTIYVAQMGFTEKPSADISFDMKSIKDISNDSAGSSSSSEASSSSAASESKPSQSSSSAASESKTDEPSKPNDNNTKPGKLTDRFENGTYNVNYHVYKSGTKTNSAMANYMTDSAKVTIKDGKATINFATKNDAMSMMKQFSVNGVKAQAKGDSWIVTLPAKDLVKTVKSEMSIFVEAINFTENPTADIVFDIAKSNSSKPSDNSTKPDEPSKPSDNSTDPDEPSKPNDNNTKPDAYSENKKLSLSENGIYSINYRVYKTGTHTTSTMQQYMTASANILVKNKQATIKFATQKDAMSLMKTFSVNGVTAHKNGNAWQVTLPVSSLRQTLKAHMTIFVPSINFTEHPDADIIFDLSSLKKSNANNSSFIPTKADNNAASGTNEVSALPTGYQNAIKNTVMHQLTILQGNSNSTSVAAQYFLPTIQLRHNKNGSYTGFITTHTPTMMGNSPITFLDGRHQVKRMSTVKTGNYYQTTYQMQFSANEIKSPIATQIHVKFTSPLPYDHVYTIRLVIGRTLNSASEATQPATGLPSMSDSMMTSPVGADVSRGTFNTGFDSGFTGNTSTMPLANPNTDNQKPNTDKKADKKSTNDTQVTKNASADSQKGDTTKRNILIVAGGVIAAALGYVVVALLTNFIKMR